jgi:hypothetical protein
MRGEFDLYCIPRLHNDIGQNNKDNNNTQASLAFTELVFIAGLQVYLRQDVYG